MTAILSDFTEKEFLQFITKICAADYPTEQEMEDAISKFRIISEHPSGSDLIYYPQKGKGTPEAILSEVKNWRDANDKPGFKAD